MPTTCPAHPAIALWTPPHRRWLAALAALADRLREARAAAAERRELRRQRHLLAQLDSRTLRDIGLGDWAAAARDPDGLARRRELDLHGF